MPGQYLTSATASTARLKVAVLDTGADCTHPDFVNTGGSSTDSAAGGQLLWSASQAYAITTHSPAACSWQDDFGHGTHVTGIIAAATSNNEGVAALGYPLQVMEFKVLDSTGTGDDSTIANAIVAATNAGARVISMSFGDFGYSQTVQNAINYAWQNNVVLVAAAGNSTSSNIFFPAWANHTIGVSATDSNNNLASFSDFGNGVSLAAPGVAVESTLPTYSVTLGCCNYGLLSGTSMATPFVSALAGLVAMTTPGATAAAILQRIEQTAASSTVGGGWSQSFGYGIINAYNAIAGIARPATMGGVSGQVVDTFGNAIAGAHISIGGQPFTTDSSGLFWIRPLAPGSYPATVSASGYATQSLSVNVTAGADTPFTVTMGVIYGSFNGTVTDQGSPVAGAIVQALSSGLLVGTAITSSNGQYTLWVRGGSGYTVQVSQIGRSTTNLTSLTVAGGGSAVVNLTLPLLGAISGVVRDSSLNPIAGTLILAVSSTFSMSAVTNASGNYTIAGLPSGAYSVTASALLYPTATQNGVNVSTDTTATVNFQLGAASPNLAVGKAATQSSTSDSTTGASKAVDGNTDGNFNDGSVTQTNFESNPWWQVDLGAPATMSSVVVWNRTDCCGDRLSDYWIFISNTPFASTDTPATLQNRAGTWSSHQTSAPNPSGGVLVSGAHGQYVRVQLGVANIMNLAEVQVIGTIASSVTNVTSANCQRGVWRGRVRVYPGGLQCVGDRDRHSSTGSEFRRNGELQLWQRQQHPDLQLHGGSRAEQRGSGLHLDRRFDAERRHYHRREQLGSSADAAQPGRGRIAGREQEHRDRYNSADGYERDILDCQRDLHHGPVHLDPGGIQRSGQRHGDAEAGTELGRHGELQFRLRRLDADVHVHGGSR